jgi:hypothetical protein
MKNVYFLSDAHLGSLAIPHARMQERRLDFSLSASAIKNTIPGDQNLVSEEEIIHNMTSSGGRIQR